MTLFGWDASDFDWPRGPMDLAAAKADGMTFFTHKATEATSTRHVHTGEALARARDAGFEFIGAYHVVRSAPGAAAQVAYFLAYLDETAPWWRAHPGFFLQVDLELWPYDAVSAAAGAAFTRALQAAQPKTVILYASRGQYGDQLAGIPARLWNANYGFNPVAHYLPAYPGDGSSRWIPYSGQVPVFLQYGSQLQIGTQPGCDANAYRGSLDDLRALITGSTTTEADMQQVLVRYTDAPVRQDGSPGYLQVYLADGMRQRPLPDEFFETPPGGLMHPRPGIIGNDGAHSATLLGNLGNNGQIILAPDGGWALRDAWGAMDSDDDMPPPVPVPGPVPLTFEETVQAAFEGAQRAERE